MKAIKGLLFRKRDASTAPSLNYTLGVLATSEGINALGDSIMGPFLPLYFHGVRGMPMTTVGTLYLVIGLARIVGAPLAGSLTDRFGPYKLMVIGPVLRGLVFLGMALCVSLDAPFVCFAAALFVAAILGAMRQNGSSTYISHIVPQDDRPVAYSKLRIGLNVGWMVGPALGAFLTRTPFSLIFSITGGLFIAGSVMTLAFCHPAESYGDDKATDDEPQGEAAQTCWQLGRSNKLLMGVLAFTFLLSLTTSQFVSTISVYTTSVVGISKISLGFLYTTNAVIVILCTLPINKRLEGKSLLLRLVGGAALYTLGYFAIGVSGSWGALAGCVIVLSLAEILLMSSVPSLISRLTPKHMLGRFVGFHGLVRGLAYALGPYIGSVVYEMALPNTVLMWSILSSFGACACIGFAFLWRKHRAL